MKLKSALLVTVTLLACACQRDGLRSPDGRITVSLDSTTFTISYCGSPVQTVETICPLEPGVNVEFKIRNDGVAFRYLEGEIQTAYLVPDGTPRWLGRYSYTGYETLFPKSTSAESGTWIYPALLEYSDGVFGFIAEAGIERGHSCSHLLCNGSDRYFIETTDSLTHYDVTPWRFVGVGSLSDVVASTMIEDLSPECALEDVSWVKPGVSSWIYWAYNHGSKDYGTICDYIDLAAEMGWPYCLVDWEWPDMEGGKTIEDVMAYAGEKRVRINLWYNSGTSWTGPGSPQPEDRLRTAESREKEFSWLESLGVAGIKVDFFAEDGAEMVDYYIDILEDAARHHLLVDFHGSTTPRGWQKTYPNLMSMEAVYGAEWYNNVPFFTPLAASHNATLPFTRGLMGPMDYTPCTFSDSQHPHITTYAHELALPVLFQSSLQHMADRPEAYRSQPLEVKDALRKLPAVWDETRLLGGYPGEFVVMARRSGQVWWIAGINGTDSLRTISFEEFSGEITLYADGLQDREFAISHTGALSSVECRPRGGFLAIVNPMPQIVPLSDNAVRVITGEPKEEELFYTQKIRRPKSRVEQTDSTYTVKQKGITTVYDKRSGGLKFFDRAGRQLVAATGGSFRGPSDEHLFGLGQFQDGYSDVKGLSRRLTQVNTQIAIPFVLSNEGYALMWNSYGLTEFNRPTATVNLEPLSSAGEATVNTTSTLGNLRERRFFEEFAGEIDVPEDGEYSLLLDVGQKMARKHYLAVDGELLIDCNNLWLPPTTSVKLYLAAGKHQVRVRGVKDDRPSVGWRLDDGTTEFNSPFDKGTDYTVFAGTADEVVGSYRTLTGPAPRMPSWMLGYVHCRERYDTQAELLENASLFRDKDIPCDVIVQDWQWWGKYGWNSMQFDEDKYPDPAAMVDSLHAMDMRLMLSVWSKVDRNSPLGKTLSDRGYYIEDTDWVDYFNPEAAGFYWRAFRDSLVRYGIDSWWFDATEPENDDLAGRNEAYRNVYPLKVVQTIYDGLSGMGKEPVIFTRSMAPGIQRYGALCWSGDVGNDWETLRRQIVGGLGLQACGLPWWTYDAGGFFRPSDQYTDPAYQQRMLRWIQTAVYMPVMRVHGYMSMTEPWRYPAGTEELFVSAIRRREALRPYLEECARRVAEEGYTMMRPLVFDFPDDEQALIQDTEYMFGPDYLVCPVLAPDLDSMTVYLPVNPSGWTYVRDGSVYKGGQSVCVALDMNDIPVFKKNQNK